MDTSASSCEIIIKVQNWLDQAVIGLNLCPFAAEPRRQHQIRFAVSSGQTVNSAQALDCLISGLLIDLQMELRLLADSSPLEIETTLLILPQGMENFADYLELLELSDQLLEEFGWTGLFQIASFHPDYCFAGTAHDSAENLTNRAPYPLLHLLREDSVEAALVNYPHPERIPQRNIQKVRELSSAQQRQLFPYLF